MSDVTPPLQNLALGGQKAPRRDSSAPDRLTALPDALLDLIFEQMSAEKEDAKRGCRAVQAFCATDSQLAAMCRRWDFWQQLCRRSGYPDPRREKVFANDDAGARARLDYWRNRFDAWCTGRAVDDTTIRDAVALLEDHGRVVPADHPNGPIERWYTEDVTDMTTLFYVSSLEGRSVFDHDIGGWDVSNVTSMVQMFRNCVVFNQPLNNWDVSRVTNMEQMFSRCHAFNQPLNNWDVSNVTDMRRMFEDCLTFQQPLDNWDVSSVTNMSHMFFLSGFNQPLNNWDVSSVTNMGLMFGMASFNQPLNNWDVSRVTNMRQMFYECYDFNQSLSDWEVSSAADTHRMFFATAVQAAGALPQWYRSRYPQ